MTKQTMDLFGDTTDVFEKESALMEEWVPEDIPERKKEAKSMAKSFEQSRRNLNDDDDDVGPQNIFASGKTGQGKTVTARVVLKQVEKMMQSNNIDINTFEVSLKDVNTSYQAVGKIIVEIEEDTIYPPTGVPQSDLNTRMFNRLDEIGGFVVLFLDEVDNLGSNDDLLYQIPRARSNGILENTHISVIGISNDLQFKSSLSAKAKDSLCEKEVHFSPYNANEIRSILEKRVETAFKDGAVEQAAIAKTAAIAAQDTGSARQAIRIIHQAGDTACLESSDVVAEKHVDEAIEEIQEVDITDTLKDMTVNDQAVLLSLSILENKNKTPARSKDVYSEYKRVTAAADIDKLTMRSVREKLTNLDTYNVVIVNERSGGVQGGKYYVSELSVDVQSIIDGFKNVSRFDDLIENIDDFSSQSTLS